MDGKQRSRLFLSLFVGVFAFGAFLRTSGSENVRAVQIVILLGCDMCLGVTLAHLAAALRPKAQ